MINRLVALLPAAALSLFTLSVQGSVAITGASGGSAISADTVAAAAERAMSAGRAVRATGREPVIPGRS